MPKRKSIPEPEPTFDVEFIRRARVTEDETWEYFIKWGGYSEDENSWEPEENLAGCRRMLKSFWEQVGSHFKNMAKKLPLDYEVKPSTLWIERERKAYRKTAEKKRARQGRAVVEDVDDDDDDDDDNNDEEKAGEDEDEDEDEDEEEVSPRASEVAEQFQTDHYLDADDEPLPLKVDRQTVDDSSSEVALAASETTSTMKRKRSEERDVDNQASSDSKKRRAERPKHQRLDAVVIPDSTRIGSQTRRNNKESRSSPRSESLFGDSDSDDIPLASESTTPALVASSQPTPTEPPPNRFYVEPSSSLVASASSKPIPAHLQRKLNPRVKAMALPIPQSGGPLGISTKARISGLTTGNAGPRSADSPLSPASPVVRNPSSTMTSDSAALASPKALQPSASAEFDATRWLQENIVVSDSVDNSSALPSATNTTQNLHFSKRWRWTGQLAVGDNESEDAFAEPVGGILLTDSTPLDRAISEVGIQILIPSHVDSLCLRHPYSLAMLPAAMADFKISQFARMGANPSDDGNFFSHLVAYMTKNDLYSQTPLFTGDHNAATMFVFPACFEYLWDQLGVPIKARQGRDLLVAIGIRVYEPPKGALGEPVETYSSDWKAFVKPDTVSETSASDFSRALQTLMFPDILYKRIAQKECALFASSTEKGKESPDTLALTTILSSAPGCKIVPILTGSARFVFIHVGAWDVLHKLIGLVDRRRRRQDVQFYTYGSDSTVEPKHWGVHEVFPIGGIVTFTPRVIAEDPEGVERLISKLDEHPLWASYVLPSVVAMTIDVVKSDNGPNSKLESAVDALSGILIPIEKGQIALTWQPPSCHAWHKDQENDTDLTPKRLSWMMDQGYISELRGHELVLECQKRLHQSQDRSEKDVELSIVKDMLVMQSELRRVYRRFVIITDSMGASNASREAAASTSASKADIKDGFEFTHVDEFAFGDDYTFVES